MTQGARIAGIDVVYAVESDPHAVATYATNHPEVKIHEGDIRKLQNLPRGLKSRKGTILFGGPPCQGFSTSNQRTRHLSNNGNWMFKEFMRFATSWCPDWIVFENVKGIAETERGTFLKMIKEDFKNLGYTTATGILNATHFGVPQHRERLFIVGSKHGIQITLPKPTTRRPIPVKYALEDLPELTNGANTDVLPYKHASRSAYAKRLRNGEKSCSGNLVTHNADYVIERYNHVPTGGNWRDIPDELMKNYRNGYECHTKIYHRLDPEKPSTVIGNYRKNMLIHPYRNRGLSVREAARIQSFPDSYKFCGSIGFQQQQVGNAVPPLLAAEVFRKIISASIPQQ